MTEVSSEIRAGAAQAPLAVSHNLIGQRLGRKGQETRERILTAMLALLDEPDGPPVTLTAVARAASVGMTTLYLYFPDIGDLLLAALKRVMSSAEGAFLHRLRHFWPDNRLAEECEAFTREHYAFWKRHSRLLHMRNDLADACDIRVLHYRSEVTAPFLALLAGQMGSDPADVDTPRIHMATVVLTGVERVATVVTNPHFHITSRGHGSSSEAEFIDNLILAEARLVEIAIRDQRGLPAT